MGEIVGDDRVAIFDVGSPTVFKNGSQHRISEEHGVALAVSDSGQIVGETDRGAFTANIDRRQGSFTFLDATLSDRRWHITEAFSVSNEGAILGIGVLRGQRNVVLLEPTL